MSQEVRQMKRYVDKRAELLKRHGDPTFGGSQPQYTEEDWRKAIDAFPPALPLLSMSSSKCSR